MPSATVTFEYLIFSVFQVISPCNFLLQETKSMCFSQLRIFLKVIQNRSHICIQASWSNGKKKLQTNSADDDWPHRRKPGSGKWQTLDACAHRCICAYISERFRLIRFLQHRISMRFPHSASTFFLAFFFLLLRISSASVYCFPCRH